MTQKTVTHFVEIFKLDITRKDLFVLGQQEKNEVISWRILLMPFEVVSNHEFASLYALLNSTKGVYLIHSCNKLDTEGISSKSQSSEGQENLRLHLILWKMTFYYTSALYCTSRLFNCDLHLGILYLLHYFFVLFHDFFTWNDKTLLLFININVHCEYVNVWLVYILPYISTLMWSCKCFTADYIL